jgi:pimeloyl-ACP methyl ester carboxylesterase
MKAGTTEVLEHCIRFKNVLFRIGVHPRPDRHFGPGGVDEAEALCRAANQDLLGFLAPPKEGLAISRLVVERSGPGLRTYRFDSPRPSGRPFNDRVALRVHRHPATPPGAPVVVFHHPIFQRRWDAWEWFFADLMRRVPVAMMAAPYHLERIPPGEFPGEGTVNPNPWRLFESLRQWSWDQAVAMEVLRRHAQLRPAAVVGFSMGAYQTLLAAAGGFLEEPLVTIACPNRYAHGLTQGILGLGVVGAMRRMGIDDQRLARMVASLELERYMDRLHGRPVLFVTGAYDRVDPPPSPERLERALRPSHTLQIEAGHGTLFLYRRRIVAEIVSFLRSLAVL